MFFNSIVSFGFLATAAQAAYLRPFDLEKRQEAGAAAVPIANFTYTGGQTGPLNWANLPGWANNRLCATGTRQSPINIDGSIGAGQAPTINYPDGRTYILENIGSTIEGHLANPAGVNIIAGQRTFNFNNFHFHTPSEHRINLESFPLEMHMVNSAVNPANNAVLTILFNIGASTNSFIASIMQNAGRITNPGTETTTGAINWSSVKSAFAASAPRKVYAGSLTTPPCTENTQFIIATTPLTISIAQYNQFKSIMKFNSRYTQNTPGQVNLLQLSQPSP